MGWLERLVGRKSSGGGVWLASGPPVEVKGEASYQAALSAICGGKCEDGHYRRVEAHLVPEPTNKYDANAVKVLVEGRLVGYLGRPNAAACRPVMQLLHRQGRPGICEATIRGGWDRGNGDEGHFGIWLELAEPGELLRSLDLDGS